jgi:mannitol-1-phosphate 5-dehydrogenase
MAAIGLYVGTTGYTRCKSAIDSSKTVQRLKNEGRNGSMQRAVIYGAGNIGRGFIGQVFHDSGYEVIFIDINRTIIDALNLRGGYTLRVVGNDGDSDAFIDNVRGIDGRDVDAVADAIAGADLMATSIGVPILPRIAGNIAEGIRRREAMGKKQPLNILLCENLMHAARHMRELLSTHLDGELLDRTGLVEVTIGRMVPALPAEMFALDPTLVLVERFCTLPVDVSKFVGEVPALAHAEYVSPFAICEEKKLYLHNMSHALCAYLGYHKGYTYLWEAAGDGAIRAVARDAMKHTASAIAEAYSADEAAMDRFSEELLERYQNRRLGDTIERVAKDPMRKLRPDDRLIGAINRCKAQGKPYDSILAGVAAALLYRPDQELKETLKNQGVSGFLTGHCGLAPEDVRAVERLMEKYPNA